jgi:hypothetical protein
MQVHLRPARDGRVTGLRKGWSESRSFCKSFLRGGGASEACKANVDLLRSGNELR